VATRTARATGTVTNTGNARSSYTARLLVNTFDAEGNLQAASVEDSATVTLDPGASSAAISLRVPVVLFGGWAMSAQVILDMASPVSRPNIDRSNPVTFEEGSSYGGSWAGTPSIGFAVGGHLGRFRKALVEAGTR